MATFNSATANHWQAYGDYSYTTSATQYVFTLKGYMRAIAWGFQLSGVEVAARAGDNKTTVSASLSTAYAGTGNSTPAAQPANYTVKRTHAAQSVLLRVYVNNATGYMSGTATAETYVTVPALDSYTITYNANGGSGAPGNQTKWYGEALTLSSTKPTRTGYTFAGWKTSYSGDDTVYAAGASYKAANNGNATLTAQWTANKYTVAFNANGGSGAPASQTKVYGTDLTLSSTKPTRAAATASLKVAFDANSGTCSTTSLTATKTTSYTFNKWTTAANGTGTSYAAGAKYTANAAATLYAQWTASANTGQITLPTPTRTGYTFNGWYTAKTGGTKVGAAGAKYTPTESTTLFAQWTAVKYTIAYDVNGGSGTVASQTKTHDVALTLTTTKPTRTNYNFLGWSASKTAAKPTYTSGQSYTANGNATLYAVWELAYTKPSVTGATAGRVAEKTEDPAVAATDPLGTVALASFAWSIGTGGTSAKSRTVQYQEAGGSWQTATNVSGAGVGDTGGTTYAWIDPADESKTYNVRVTVTDQTGGSTSRTVTVGSAQVPIDVGKKGRAVGVLAKAGDEGTLTVGGKVVMGDQLLSNAGGGTFNVAHVFGGDQWGAGVAIGGGGATIVGSGESWSALESVADATTETLHLGSDGSIYLHANCNTIGNRKTAVIDTNGTYVAPTRGVSYLNGAKGQGAVYQKKSGTTQWAPAVVMQTNGGGAWQMGNYNDENLLFCYHDRAAIDADTNGPSQYIFFTPTGILSRGTYRARGMGITSGVRPSTSVNGAGLGMMDSNDAYVASVNPRFLTNGTQGLDMYATRVIDGANVYNSLDLWIDESGNRSVSVSDQAAWRAGIGAVSKSGDTMTGGLVMSNQTFTAKDTDVASGTNPSSNVYGDGFRLYDKNNYCFFNMRSWFLTNGNQGVQLEAHRVVNGSTINNTLNLGIDGSGNRVVQVSAGAQWRSALSLANTTISSTSGTFTVSSGITVSLFAVKYSATHVTIRIESKKSTATAANTAIQLGTISNTALRPWVDLNGCASLYAACWITKAGAIWFQSNAAIAANAALNVNFDYAI